MTNSQFSVFNELLVRRHSCRAFLPDPVPRATIEQILAAAQRTASWCNAQPWQVRVVSGQPLEELRGALMARAAEGASISPELDWPREYRGVHLERRRESGWRLYEAVGIAKGDREASRRQMHENFRLFGAPHALIVSYDEALGTHGAVDCGAWVANFTTAAAALGVSSIAQAALASWPDILRSRLGIPTEQRILCGISFGYEDAEHPANRFRTDRAALGEVVTWYGS